MKTYLLSLLLISTIGWANQDAQEERKLETCDVRTRGTYQTSLSRCHSGDVMVGISQTDPLRLSCASAYAYCMQRTEETAETDSDTRAGR